MTNMISSDSITLEAVVDPLLNPEPVALPVSSGQERMWFLEQLHPNNWANNMTMAHRINGPLNPAALQQSVADIVNRHEILRTKLVMESDSSLLQIIYPVASPDFQIIDLRNHPEADREAAASALMTQKAQHCFNLSEDFLMQITLLQLSETAAILILNFHHIVFDGWSVGLFYQELGALYRHHTAYETLDLPELAIQYGDYAVWQREWLESDAYHTQLDYWKSTLGDSQLLLELPTNRARGPIQTFAGRKRKITIPPALYSGLQKLSQQESSTLFMTLLSAYQTLLYRYTHQTDIIVGSPIANRNLTEIEDLIGFFVNTLVLRGDLSGNPSFRALLRQMRQVTLSAYSHQEIPFEKLVEELQPNRNLSQNPLFQVLLQVSQEYHLALADLVVTPLPLDNEAAQFDLALHLYDNGTSLTGHFEYNTDLFDPEMIDRFSEQFLTLMQAVVTNPDASIATLPLLSETAQTQLLVDWNQTEQEIPQGGVMHRLIEAEAARVPERVAVEFGGKMLTYRQLDERANQVAHYLQKQGVVVGNLVGIYVERSLEMVVGLLGILKAGGTYVPLDPAFPPDRIGYMIDDAQMALIVTQSNLVQHLPRERATVVCLDDDWPKIGQEATTPVECKIQGDDLAYIIYTSGSTGKPKGVQLPHRAVSNFLVGMKQKPGMSETDTLLAVTTLSFDIAVLELYLPLTIGGKVVIASRTEATDGHKLIELIEQHQINVMQATPTTWRLMLSAGWAGNDRLKILCGGEAMPPDLAETLVSRCNELWNMYGPTETTVWSTVYQVKPENAKEILIGRPIANTEIYILDQHHQPVPLGVVGTLHIGGDGLAKGYLNRADLTAEKFIPHPFKEQGRIYNTGDLARYRVDGQIECLGRVDYQVKIRGYRIELGEIEAVMAQFSGVDEAAVAVKENGLGRKQLVGYFTQQADEVDLAKLRTFLKQTLPDYMVPIRYVRLDDMPLTPNRKINRQALPEPDRSRPTVADELTEPRTPTEEKLVAIFKEVLNLDAVGINDNFFELGGNSLLAAYLFHQIETVFSEKYPLATLFQAPTIAQLATVLFKKTWTAPWTSLVPMKPDGHKPPFFFIHAHGGNVVGFHPLADHLPADQPFYALQAQDLDKSEIIHRRFEEMAAHYITEIKTVQARGPYFLGGWCLGSDIALEMAHQLTEQGDTVGLVIMLENPRPEYYLNYKPGTTALHKRFYQLATRLDMELSNLLEVESHLRGEFLQARTQRLMSTLRGYGEGKLNTFLNKLNRSLPRSRDYTLAQLGQDHQQAYLEYKPKPYAGRTLLLTAAKQLKGVVPDPTLGWGAYFDDNLEIIEIPGHRIGILDKPRVKILAEHIICALEQAQSELSLK